MVFWDMNWIFRLSSRFFWATTCRRFFTSRLWKPQALEQVRSDRSEGMNKISASREAAEKNADAIAKEKQYEDAQTAALEGNYQKAIDILAKKTYPLNEMEIYPLLCELSAGDGNYDEKIAQINRILTFQECYNY